MAFCYAFKLRLIFVGVFHILMFDAISVTSGTTGPFYKEEDNDSDVFRIEPTELSIPPNSTKQYLVTFSPNSDNTYTATLTISSNDLRLTSVNIPLKGSGRFFSKGSV